MPERFVWIAVYKNGDLLFQCDEFGEVKHKFAEIDQERLEKFSVFDRETGRKIILNYNPSMKLIFYWDRYITVSGNKETRSTVACFGWQKGSSKTIIRWYEDGHLEAGDE
ncbi:MAG: hypothetical protein M1542_07540 [Thermotogae bacterium]|jgi:hypothetical protein|nr:hypothetical protein [Thermotogota bacterium]MCL5033077.1 hypothetical protein [Thermotogota bacterium]